MKLLFGRRRQGAYIYLNLQVQALQHLVRLRISHLQLRAVHTGIGISRHLQRAPYGVRGPLLCRLRHIKVYDIGHLVGREVVGVITAILKVVGCHIVNKACLAL